MRLLCPLLLCLTVANPAVAAPEATGLAPGDVARFVRLALECVHQEYPNKIAHVLQSDADVRPPRELTPAFAGCFDWHSAVHGHWLLARVARLMPAASFADSARAALDRSLTPENVAAEVAYLQGEDRASFERPYGLAWLLQLCAELRSWPDDEDARRWSANLRPLEVAAAARLRDWLPKLRYPIRTGEHSQTAFALGLALDWAQWAGDGDLAALIDERSRTYHLADTGCPLAWEPGGQDFLSPCLAEADLMRRVLDTRAFAGWLAEFLPRIPADGSAGWLPVAEVTDRSDGKLAHLDGLNLSRAWMLEGIAAGLPPADPRRAALLAAATAHRDAGLAAVSGEFYAGGHWLGSFATYLVTRRGIVDDPRLATVLAFRNALACGEMAAARGYLTGDARVWWERKTGDGSPWLPGEGRWQAWDEEFRATSRIVGWDAARADTVSCVVEEMNDYYRLTGRGPQRYRRFYFLAPAHDRIAGTMIQAVQARPDAAPSLFPGFEAWAREHAPREIDYLLTPDGGIDPTGDRPALMRALLSRWREATGRDDNDR